MYEFTSAFDKSRTAVSNNDSVTKVSVSTSRLINRPFRSCSHSSTEGSTSLIDRIRQFRGSFEMLEVQMLALKFEVSREDTNLVN